MLLTKHLFKCGIAISSASILWTLPLGPGGTTLLSYWLDKHTWVIDWMRAKRIYNSRILLYCNCLIVLPWCLSKNNNNKKHTQTRVKWFSDHFSWKFRQADLECSKILAWTACKKIILIMSKLMILLTIQKSRDEIDRSITVYFKYICIDLRGVWRCG